MTPSKELAFASDDELFDNHTESFSQIKLEMNEKCDDGSASVSDAPGTPSNFENEGVEVGAEASESTVVSDEEKNSDQTYYPDRASIRAEVKRRHSTSMDHIPRISITPMTPGSVSPDDDHSTVSLNSGSGSPLFQSQKYRGKMSMSPNLYWRPQSPMPPKNDYEAKEFFAYRDSIVEKVLEEVETLVMETDGQARGTWLLTESVS